MFLSRFACEADFLRDFDVSHNIEFEYVASVVVGLANGLQSAEISLKLLEIPQKLFNVSFIVTRFPFMSREFSKKYIKR